MNYRIALMSAFVGLCGTYARAQSIYVDMDINSGDAGVGNGAPSSGFGGAAGVPGVWNRVPTLDFGPWALLDTVGHTSNAALTWTHSGGDIGFRNLSNTGDYALLLNDAEEVGGDVLRFTITGLNPGSYKVFTYAVEPQGNAATTFINVPGSSTPEQSSTGPMPGNQLIQGVTHTIHNIDLTGGPLTIEARGQFPFSYVNGFQILSVPEPASALACACGLFALGIRRKRPM